MAFRMIRIPLIKNNKDIQIFNTWLLKQMRMPAIMINIPLIIAIYKNKYKCQIQNDVIIDAC